MFRNNIIIKGISKVILKWNNLENEVQCVIIATTGGIIIIITIAILAI